MSIRQSVKILAIMLLAWLPGIGVAPIRGEAQALTSGQVDIFAAYPDPASDIIWTASGSTVDTVQEAFNQARQAENSQLGTSLPTLSLPDQAAWTLLGDAGRALWLIQKERIDRGIPPLSGWETNVTGVSQYYANYLLTNNVFSHNADGNSPTQRMKNNPTIGSCNDSYFGENIYNKRSTAPNITLPVEKAVFVWMYTDAIPGWGHRHLILSTIYNDNSGPSGQEGFLGIGLATGPYEGWAYGAVVVMDVFDPCASWNYPAVGDRFVFLPRITR